MRTVSAFLVIIFCCMMFSSTGCSPSNQQKKDLSVPEDREQFNSLVNPVIDTTSGTPEMSVCSVRLEKVRETKKRNRLSVTQ